MRLILICLAALAIAACQGHWVIDPDAKPPVPRMRPHVAPTVSLLPTITPTPEGTP